MQISLVMKTARSATFLLDDGGIYHTKKEYKILLNNKEIKTTDTVVTSVFDLKPDTDYFFKIDKNPMNNYILVKKTEHI